jgi:sugar-specific transcriptional regulator TrmB
MQDIDALGRIGLTKNDRKVYLTLIELGISTVSDLTKRTSLHRSYVYDILDKLIDMGLVSFTIKNKKKYFDTENPDRILQILKNKEQEIKESKIEINKILPELVKRQKIKIEKQEAKIFIGKEGIKSILEDVLKTKKDFVAFGAEGKFKDIFKWYFDNWQNRRIKLKIRYKIIYNNRLKGKRPTKEQKLVKIRFLPEKYEFPATNIIYGNKIAIIVWEISPIGFVLESEKAVKSFLSYFDLLWGLGK